MSWNSEVRNRVYIRTLRYDTRYVNPNVPIVMNSSSYDSPTTFPNNRQTTSSDPNWRQKIALRQDASLPYRRVQTDIKNVISRCTTITVEPGATVRSTHVISGLYNMPSLGSGVDLGLQDLALTRLKRKIQSHSGSMNACVPLAELTELRGLIRSMAETTGVAIKKLIEIKKRSQQAAKNAGGHYRNARQREADERRRRRQESLPPDQRTPHYIKPKKDKYYVQASRVWLSYSFGIKPLMNEVTKIAESISDFMYNGSHNVVLSGTASRDWFSGKRDTIGQQGPHRSTEFFDHDLYHELSYQYKGGFHIPVSAANDYDMMDHFGFSIPSLVPTAWELVPYSWVVDYFTNVGTFLDDVFTVTPGVSKYLTCTRKYRIHGVQRSRYTKLADDPPYFTVISDVLAPPTHWDHLDMERTKLTAIPMATLRLKSADEVSMNSINKLFNLLAILGK